MISLMIDEQLRSFEITRGDPHIILLIRMVELSETPINESDLALSVVDHNIMRFHISVDYPLRMTEIQSSEDFIHVKSDIEVCQLLIERSEIIFTSLHILHDLNGISAHVPEQGSWWLDL